MYTFLLLDFREIICQVIELLLSQPLKNQKRPRESGYLENHIPSEQSPKPIRPSIPDPSRGQALDREALSGPSTSQQDHHISYWVCQGYLWPKEYFQDSMHRFIQKKQSSATFDASGRNKALPPLRPQATKNQEMRRALHTETRSIELSSRAGRALYGHIGTRYH